MLGIWHEGDWLKRDLVQLIYGQVLRGNPEPVWPLHSSIRDHFILGILWVNIIIYMWIIWLLYARCFYWLYVGHEYQSIIKYFCIKQSPFHQLALNQVSTSLTVVPRT